MVKTFIVNFEQISRCYDVSIVDFEQVNAACVKILYKEMYFKEELK